MNNLDFIPDQMDKISVANRKSSFDSLVIIRCVHFSPAAFNLMCLSICAIFTIEQFPLFVVFIVIDYYNICQNNQKYC